MEITKQLDLYSSDTREVITILEHLDNDSIMLAKGYMAALSDRQEVDRIRAKKEVIG